MYIAGHVVDPKTLCKEFWNRLLLRESTGMTHTCAKCVDAGTGESLTSMFDRLKDAGLIDGEGVIESPEKG